MILKVIWVLLIFIAIVNEVKGMVACTISDAYAGVQRSLVNIIILIISLFLIYYCSL